MKKKTDTEKLPFWSSLYRIIATIGTGNIVSVSAAISTGGPGALFWMILTAFLGNGDEIFGRPSPVKYRTIDEDGRMCAGPILLY